MQLMDQLEQKDGRGCELQFYIDAAKEHQTFEEAKRFLDVECPICIEHYITHEVRAHDACLCCNELCSIPDGPDARMSTLCV